MRVSLIRATQLSGATLLLGIWHVRRTVARRPQKARGSTDTILTSRRVVDTSLVMTDTTVATDTMIAADTTITSDTTVATDTTRIGTDRGVITVDTTSQR